MAKASGSGGKKIDHKPKRTSTSAKASMVKTSSMNKYKKRSFKKYRGQGRK